MHGRGTLAAASAMLLILVGLARAEISLRAENGNHPYLFGNGMVLQRGRTGPVWGTALADVSIRADLVDPSLAPGSQLLQSVSTTSSASGRWVVRFADLPLGGPYELQFRAARAVN
jgi:hypothetical protein